MMDIIGNRLKIIKKELQDYIETRLALKAIDVGEKITYLVGQFIQQLIGYTVLIIGLLFGLVALAIYVGDLVGHLALGYAIVCSPFLIIGLFLVIAKPKSIALSIQDKIMNELLDNLEDKDEMIKQLSSPKEKSNGL